MRIILEVVDIFFFVFHVSLILFNLFGWTSKRLRGWNLVTLSITAFSWFILGFFYGFGYCFLTDWHWQVRDELGYVPASDSYIHFLLTTLLPLSISEQIVDWLTLILFVLAFLMSIITNLREKNHKADIHP
ncbi:DUF2784 family protein [Chryseolinea sp. H1M3-3]|uniref:DUF2784 family protein n=1 Tax=Chryseolinea sp. H1M3-3 TaxID=3034144 RepID=UPI0023ED4FDD|nr:DUF2784 family protein [Chryseolinea sp. H1M3-3]